MKKLISFALAIVLIICLSTTAFATEVTTPGDYTAEVTGSYVAGNESNGIVYCVDIEWANLDFTYYAEKGAVWNTETLTYSEVTPAYWEGEGSITIANRSNTKISAKPTYTPADGYSGADMEFSTNNLKVASAESGTEQTGTITVTPSGVLPAINTSDTIGTITLTIARDTDINVAEAIALADDVDALLEAWCNAGQSDSDEDYKNMEDQLSAFRTTIAIYQERGDDEQSSLNMYYAETLEEYKIFKEKYDALAS